MYTVYCHECKKNGKYYVGITKNSPETRWNHGRGYRENKKFYADIQKYGWDNFSHEILATGLTKEEAQKQEQRYINEFDSLMSGYNNEPGGRISEPTYLSPTLTNIRRSIKRTKYAKWGGYREFIISLDDAEKDRDTASIWNAMGENALAFTMQNWDEPHWDTPGFFCDFVLHFSEELRLMKWIINGCEGEKPNHRKPCEIISETLHLFA